MIYFSKIQQALGKHGGSIEMRAEGAGTEPVVQAGTVKETLEKVRKAKKGETIVLKRGKYVRKEVMRFINALEPGRCLMIEGNPYVLECIGNPIGGPQTCIVRAGDDTPFMTIKVPRRRTDPDNWDNKLWELAGGIIQGPPHRGA